MFQLSYNMKINTKKMKKLEKEYSVIKAKEQEEMVELKVSIIIKVWRLYQQYLYNFTETENWK